MKTLIKKSTLAVAVSVVLGSSAAWADPVIPVNDVTATNTTNVNLDKTVTVNKDFSLNGEVAIKGLVQVDSSAMATVDNKQSNHDNKVSTGDVQDPAFTTTTSEISGNTGNVGVNVTAGLYNQQDNAAAISSFANPQQASGTDYKGSADAEVFSNQNLAGSSSSATPGQVATASNGFDVDLVGASYNATTGVIDGNSGNLGVNVSAGVSNLQKNSLAIAQGDSGLSEASSATLQETSGLSTQVTASSDQFGNTIVASYNANLGAVTGNAGNVGVNLSSGTSNIQANSLALATVQ